MKPGIKSALILLPVKEQGVPKPPKHEILSKKEIGRRLRAVRQARGITQVQLAKVLGTQQTAISQVELGNRGLTIQQVVKLAKALNVSTDAILSQPRGTDHESLPKDRKLLQRIQRIERLPRSEKQALLKTIDAFLKSAQVA
jgi:transcriptional regulator with XRE-family HTH domain